MTKKYELMVTEEVVEYEGKPKVVIQTRELLRTLDQGGTVKAWTLIQAPVSPMQCCPDYTFTNRDDAVAAARAWTKAMIRAEEASTDASMASMNADKVIQKHAQRSRERDAG